MEKLEVKNNNIPNKRGFTYIELLVVIGLMSILFGITFVSLFRFQGTTSQQSNTDALIADIKSQQLKAMTGNTEGRVDSDNYGVYFQSDSYVLFHGDVYNSSDPSNFQVDLPSDLEFKNTTLPNNSIIFARQSGNFTGFAPGQDSFTIRALNIGVDMVVTFNRYGVITSVVR